MAAMSTPGQFTLQTQNLGCLPIVNFFLTRIGVADHLRTYLPPGDARLRLTPAAVVEVVVRNLVVGHRPLYALGEWAVSHHEVAHHLLDHRCRGQPQPGVAWGQ